MSTGASGSAEPHAFGWRDAMDIVVRWRQLSEPNDQACMASLLRSLLICLRSRHLMASAFRSLLTLASNLQVIWVDLLTREEFEAGFGSHTPIFSGQTKCVRYYMNFGRGLALLKEVLAEVGAPSSL